MKEPAVGALPGGDGDDTQDFPSEKPGDAIGPYKLLERIGEGGMGIIYLAEQQTPVVRRVALKIIKWGMDTKQVLARFEAERQALALMDHPNIAKIFDGGNTETGRSYFVMELVRGLPITEYCNQYQVGIRQRLEIFLQVCSAVHHAHQKGIIHRDLKPSNVLVTRIDDAAVPKVIDFGIAKATQQRLTEKTLITNFHLFIGTPAYMSPEQAQIGAQDIDTRSDIYSLGVLLYELLTGRTPFSNEELMSGGYEEIRRIVRESEPLIPSRKLSSLPWQDRTDISKQQQTEPAALDKTLRGELDWIIMMALEKDRTRRFETANAFRMDIERYLEGKPVSAVAPDPVYVLRKFAYRHRTPIAAVSLFIVLLVVGTGISLSGWREAIRVVAQLEHQEDKLIASERSASWAAHDATLILASQRLDEGLQAQAKKLLREKVPESTRGFAWRLLVKASEPKAFHSVEVQQGKNTDLAISPNGRQLAIGGIHSTIVRDLITNQTVHDLPTDDKNFDWVSYVSHEEIIRHNTQYLEIIDANTGTIKSRVQTYPIFNPGTTDSHWFPYMNDEQVWFLDGKTGTRNPYEGPLPKIAPGERYFLNMIESEKYLMTGIFSKHDFGLRNVRVINPVSMDLVLELPDSRWGADFYAPRDLLAVCNGIHGPHQGVSLYDLKEGRLIVSRYLGADPVAMRFSHDGSTLAITTGMPELLLWNLELDEIESLGKLDAVARGLVYTADGETLITGHHDGFLRFHSLTARESHVSETRFQTQKVSISYVHDTANPRLAIGPVESGEILICSIPDLDIVHRLDEAEHPLRFLEEDKLLSTSGNALRTWDLFQGDVVSEVPLSPPAGTPFIKPALSPDGRFLAVASEATQGRIRLYQVDGGKATREIEWKVNVRFPMTDQGRVIFSPDNRWLAACVENGFTGGEIWIHDLVENRSTKLGSDDTAFIHSLAFSTDSLGLISASSGGLRYWNVGGSEQVSELPSFDSKSVAFCPDGKLICVGRVNDIKFWNAETLRELLSIPWSTGHLVAGAYIDPTSRYLIGFQGRVEKEFNEMTLRVWATGEGRNHEVGPKP